MTLNVSFDDSVVIFGLQMMFSMEKCSGRSGTATSEESELYAGGGEGMGKEGVASDEVASAVAAVSDEIGDILKDELGDADRADRIGAELADLSAELGLLAGLADGEAQPDFASRFEVPFEWIAVSYPPIWLSKRIFASALYQNAFF